MQSSKLKIAFIGVGAMGLPMAKRLATSDAIELSVFDASPKAREAAVGVGRAATSLQDAITGVDVICTMLPADEHVRSVASELVALGAAGADFR